MDHARRRSEAGRKYEDQNGGEKMNLIKTFTEHLRSLHFGYSH
jgi:hypothetical protein